MSTETAQRGHSERPRLEDFTTPIPTGTEPLPEGDQRGRLSPEAAERVRQRLAEIDRARAESMVRAHLVWVR